MKQNIITFTYLIVCLLIVGFVAKSLDVFITDREQRVIPVVYVDESGQLKYASGVCSTNSDCFEAGCGLDFCSNEKDLVTTCELKPDAPDKNTYSCGCYGKKCAWVKK